MEPQITTIPLKGKIEIQGPVIPTSSESHYPLKTGCYTRRIVWKSWSRLVKT